MLFKHNQVNRDQIEMIALNQLVPADHLFRKMEAAFDFYFILLAFGPSNVFELNDFINGGFFSRSSFRKWTLLFVTLL